MILTPDNYGDFRYEQDREEQNEEAIDAYNNGLINLTQLNRALKISKEEHDE